jgi:hypothetical protein
MEGFNMSMKKKLDFEEIKNKRKKSILILFLVLLSSLILCSCNSKNQTVAKEYMDKVELLNQGGIPTLQQVKDLDTGYYNLTPKQKELVTNYGTVKKYLDLDLDSIHSIQLDIDTVIAQSNTSYKDIKNIEERYNQLSSEQKTYILNIDQLVKFKELNEYDKASIIAIRYLKQMLKNSDSIKLSEINGKKEGTFYFIKINYSATNDFGGRKDNVVCLDVSDDYKIGIISLFDTADEFRETSDDYVKGYLEEIKSTEYPVDCDKVMDNIDKEF